MTDRGLPNHIKQEIEEAGSEHSSTRRISVSEYIAEIDRRATEVTDNELTRDLKNIVWQPYLTAYRSPVKISSP